FSFETEVSPLQLLLIGRDYFCFYRYVWHDNNRYTQGFIIKSNEFLMALTEDLISSTDFNSLLFSTKGNLLQKINLGSAQQEYPLYSRNLSMPFQKLELLVNAVKLTDVPGGLMIDLLALAIYGIFFIGFIAFYRLGSRQIDLAKQQQNFISAVSHELKTPLTSIRMYGEMLRSGWVTDDSKKQNYYDFIFFESERLSRLIANVLQLARLGHQKQNNSDVILTTAQSLLNRISSRVEAQIEPSVFELQLCQPDNTIEPIDIKVDEDAFFQIVINLVDNAIKFANTSDKNQIDIGFTLSSNHKHVIFFIRDYGPGIKKNQLKKIFRLFYRSGDELTRTTPGTGIGLALVAQLAETMHASITVVNKQPGAEFQIKLPIDK
ncbi:MAG: HAMP domain-containing histidine kinase, partial [Methylococcales bacterium]|nr:HAMP domain-containing histidine kinase [Methylococcales bacterium]